MSFFGVTIERIATVKPIPKADLIVVATLEGLAYKFVIGKDSFKPGDYCVYFPIDSLLPPELVEKLGLTGKLSGKEKNRVKTVKLRKQISQGIVGNPSCVPITDASPRVSMSEWPSEFLTQELGVTKYEPPVSSEGNVILKSLPDGKMSTGPLGPFEFFRTLQDSEIVLWDSRQIQESDGSTTTVYMQNPTTGKEILSPGNHPNFFLTLLQFFLSHF